MLNYLTVFKVVDNSGCKLAQCIKIYKGFKFQIGSIILVNIKEVKHQKRIKKGSLIKAIIVRIQKKNNLKIGNSFNFSENAVILLSSKTELVATRIFGPISNILRKKTLAKLLSLSSNIV